MRNVFKNVTGVNARTGTLRRAYHEAGHAVAAYALGYYVSRVTIRARGDVGGECRAPGFLSERNPGSDEGRFLADLIWTVAGVVAECIAVRTHSREGGLTGEIPQGEMVRIMEQGGSDWLEFNEALNRLSDTCTSWVGKEEEIRSATIAQAFSSLIALWPHVEAVTAALLEKKTLRHEDIARLLPVD